MKSSPLQARALRGVGKEAARNVDEFSALRHLLERDLSSSLWILGFASTPGTPSANLDLAERRARALQAHLLRTDLAAVASLQGRIKTLALGESDVSGVEPTANAQLAIAFVCIRPT